MSRQERRSKGYRRSEDVPKVGLGPYFVGQNNRLSNFFHRLASIHGHFLNAPKSFGFRQSLRIHEDAFGPVNEFARFELIGKIVDLFFEFAEFAKAR